MILDRAEDLRNLARDAHRAASAEQESTAFAYVEEAVKRATEEISGFAVAEAPWAEQLGEDLLEDLRAIASRLADVVRPLRDLSDQELAAYGNSAERGRLAVVKARATDLREALQAAHEALLNDWAASVWPQERMAELRVRQQLPDAESADIVKLALDRLSVTRRNPSESSLREAQAVVTPAQEAARRLEGSPVPPEVVEFWQQVENAGAEGVPLTSLSLQMHEWLEEHQAGAHFRLSAEQ